MAKLFDGIFKDKENEHFNLGDLYFEFGTITFTTTGTSVAITTALSEIVAAVASPFHASAHNANDVLGIDSDSLSSGSVNLIRPASGTSGLVAAYLLIGRKVSTT